MFGWSLWWRGKDGSDWETRQHKKKFVFLFSETHANILFKKKLGCSYFWNSDRRETLKGTKGYGFDFWASIEMLYNDCISAVLQLISTFKGSFGRPLQDGFFFKSQKKFEILPFKNNLKLTFWQKLHRFWVTA